MVPPKKSCCPPPPPPPPYRLISGTALITRVITQKTMDSKLKNLKSAKNSVPLRRSFVNIFWPLTLSGWGSPAHTISFTIVVLQPIDLSCLFMAFSFIFKTYFEKFFCKIEQPGGCCYFFLERSKTFLK